MTNDRPPQIRTEHLSKLALIYLRQSTLEQVRSNVGSTEDQRGLARLPRDWGWSESRIIVIDDDLGLSGTSSQNRTGFQRLLNLIDRDEVAIVLVRDVSRISRNPLDAERFITTAVRVGILIYANGRLYDTSTGDIAELFGLRMQNVLAWWENGMRARTFRLARLAKITTKRLAVSRPPIGYVESVKGLWVKDPQPGVADTIRRVSEFALELRSINKIRAYMWQHTLPFPSRRRGQVTWGRVTRYQITGVLSHPAYVGDYVYGRSKRINTDEGTRTFSRPPSEWLVIRDHHAGYVTREEWAAIQVSLAARRPSVRPPICKGAALLQGIIWCGPCDRPMGTRYNRRDPDRTRVPSYVCRPVDRFDVAKHSVSISHRALDQAVLQAALPRLKSIDPDTARTVIEESQKEWEDNRRARRRLLDRLEDEVRERRHRYDSIDPDHRLVKQDHEVELEDARLRLEEAKGEVDQNEPPPPVKLTHDDIAELMSLVAHIEDIWTAATTTNEDRKFILQGLISRVVIRSASDDSIDVEIAWDGGGANPLQVLRPQGVDKIVMMLRQGGLNYDAIIEELQRRGITNRDGRPITEAVIGGRLRARGLNWKHEWAHVLLRIRELMLERRTGKEMLAMLCADGPPHPHGQWTRGRVDLARQTLRLGKAPREVPPLPAVLPPDPRRQRSPAVLDAMEQLLAAGQNWRAIAVELNARGLKPPRAETFNPGQARALHTLLRRKSFPVETPPGCASQSSGPAQGPE